MSSVLVLGGGFAGLLAAAAAGPYADTVTVVERDAYPVEPQPRRGQPQARHPHFLAPGGVLGAERLLPGVTDRLAALGAHRIGVGADLLFRAAGGGWLDRADTGRVGISCTRNLLDHAVRELIREQYPVMFRTGCDAVELIGDSRAIRGARVRDLRTGAVDEYEADLVIDATGRGSRAAAWLDRLGIAVPGAETVDSGHAYATQMFRAAPGAESDFPMILIQADGRSGRPAANAILLPVENGQWQVAVGGTRGMSLPTDDAEFRTYARDRPADPLLGDMLAGAESLSGTMVSRSSGNRRWRFDRIRHRPCGFVVTGDAATALNPVYGHGLSTAVRCATAIRATLAARGADPVAAAGLQRSICRAASDPWQIATSQDRQFSATDGAPLSALERAQLRYGEQALRAAAYHPAVAAIVSDVMFLARPARSMGHPVVAAGALLGSRRPVRSEAPLSAREFGFRTSGRVA
ncbi:NAD(P)/FAD-dependent oxidoreductase [Nocardia stercoris]|nr:FAD-binding protein [Nocardia stercoris]